ncbi:hypothetical protein P5673_029853 [Acropora cervicornis]|uniref:Uncharacterized protein n=1 Tax=Acropora cervicornis TaxID=6130 RepID=A0AAD9UTN6_ACRCE|nr:hypothetical protein P5673_029853 [Acropora cervicornis]
MFEQQQAMLQAMQQQQAQQQQQNQSLHFCYEIKHIAGADNHADALSLLLGPGTGFTPRKSNHPGTDSLETYCQASTRGLARSGTQEDTAQRESVKWSGKYKQVDYKTS